MTIQLPHLKELNIIGTNVRITEDVDFVTNIAPQLEVVGDLGSWEISHYRISELQKQTKTENLLLTIKATTLRHAVFVEEVSDGERHAVFVEESDDEEQNVYDY